MQQEKAKDAASIRALEEVHDGMVIGLGTGTTAAHFIKHLIQKKPTIQAVATSIASEKLARQGNIPLLDINTLTTLDLTVDGADEIDPQKRLIKGAGGAFVREKIIATMSKKMIVIADESKFVQTLGRCPLPIEVIPFGIESTKKQIQELGYSGSWRKTENNTPYVTDNGNWIFDLHFSTPLDTPEDLQTKLLQIPGVVETGLFLNLATQVILGKEDGTTTIINEE